MIALFQAAVALLDTTPGVDRRIAKYLIAEIGVDMGRFDRGLAASRTGMCPSNRESGGKRKLRRTCQGSKWLGGTLPQSAKSAGRPRTSPFAVTSIRVAFHEPI